MPRKIMRRHQLPPPRDVHPRVRQPVAGIRAHQDLHDGVALQRRPRGRLVGEVHGGRGVPLVHAEAEVLALAPLLLEGVVQRPPALVARLRRRGELGELLHAALGGRGELSEDAPDLHVCVQLLVCFAHEGCAGGLALDGV